jgi:flagellar assembly factor FliW
MEKINTRFGEVEYDPDNLLVFQGGLIGLPKLRQFIVMPNKKKGPLFWIQSVDDPDFAFVLTDPTNFFLDYQISLEQSERQTLNISEEDEFFVLSIVTVPPDQNITLNLAAPILFAPKTNRALQLILENSPYSTKTPLPK